MEEPDPADAQLNDGFVDAAGTSPARATMLASAAHALDDQYETAIRAELAAEKLASVPGVPFAGPLAQVLKTMAAHARDGLLLGLLPYRIQQLAAAIIDLPAAADDQRRKGGAVSAAISQALLALNADPDLVPGTAWYAEVAVVGNIVHNNGVRERIELVRLHDGAAFRAGLLDDLTDGELYE